MHTDPRDTAVREGDWTFPAEAAYWDPENLREIRRTLHQYLDTDPGPVRHRPAAVHGWATTRPDPHHHPSRCALVATGVRWIGLELPQGESPAVSIAVSSTLARLLADPARPALAAFTPDGLARGSLGFLSRQALAELRAHHSLAAP